MKMTPNWQGRDLGVAFQAPPGSQASSRGEVASGAGVAAGVGAGAEAAELAEARPRQPIPVFLPGESQGQKSLMGCCLWGRTESDTTEVTYAAPVGVFSRGTTRISGSLSCGAREVRSPCAWRGGARPGSRVTGGD